MKALFYIAVIGVAAAAIYVEYAALKKHFPDLNMMELILLHNHLTITGVKP